MQIIRQSSFKAVPWKNGGGITHEAIRVPPTGETFRWRVSIARIDASGPFSDFAGYHRTMVLLRGAGVALELSDGSRRVLKDAGDMAEFDGALGAECELLDGPCTDLNLIADRSLAPIEARVERLRHPLSMSGGAVTRVVLPIEGSLEVHAGGATAVLEPWDLAVIGTGAAVRLVARGANAATVFVATLSGS
jgi:environmental stress-induced protein Ves